MCPPLKDGRNGHVHPPPPGHSTRGKAALEVPGGPLSVACCTWPTGQGVHKRVTALDLEAAGGRNVRPWKRTVGRGGLERGSG